LIDIVSNELADLFIDGSARVHYEFYGADYTKQLQIIVSARLQLKALSLDGNTATNITCNGVANGTATVTVSGGISPYTYMG
jgi:predicted TIM-barrel enzyme